MSPKVTIVITTKDRPQWVQRAVESALAQTEKDIEVIVVDDGSRQPVGVDSDDPRLRVERLETSRGPNGARNRGIELARGEWTTFLDDDDVILPPYIANALAGVRASVLPPPIAVMSPGRAVDPDGREITTRGHMPPLPRGAGRYVNRAGHKGRGFGGTLFVPTAVFREVGGFDERLHAWESHDMLLMLDPVCSVDVIDEIGYLHTDHGGSRQSKNLIANATALEVLVDKHAEALGKNPALRADYCATSGGYFLKAGRWGPAVRMTSRALVMGRFRPKLIRLWIAALLGPGFLWIVRKLRGRGPRLRSGV